MRFELRFGPARVRAITDVAADVRMFEIVPAAGVQAYRPGSHLAISVLIDGRPDTRHYSLVGHDPFEGAYRIAVKKAPESRGGSDYMWRLQPGASIEVSEPRNLFEPTFGRPAYLLVAGGIGVTPMVGMAAAFARANAPVRVLYGGRSRALMPFADEIAAEVGPERLALYADDEGQRMDLAAEIAALPEGGELYVCGPIGLLDAARRTWAAAGRPDRLLRFETFGSSGQFAPEAFTVSIPRLHLDIVVPENRSLLSALEEAGVEVLSDCRRGECGLCQLDVVSTDGVLDHRDVFLSDHQKEEGHKICACVSRVARGNIVVDTADRAL